MRQILACSYPYLGNVYPTKMLKVRRLPLIPRWEAVTDLGYLSLYL